MKKTLILISLVLSFAMAGMFAQTVTEPVPAPSAPTQAAAKSGKHKKHKHHKHHKKHKKADGV